MQQVDNMCWFCDHFNRYDHECAQGHYLETSCDGDKYVIECEDYKEQTNERPLRE